MNGNKTTLTLRITSHRRPEGEGNLGQLTSPLEFEKMTSYAAVLQNTVKFSLAPSALALDTLYFSLKRREKNAKNFRLRLRRAGKRSIFVRRAENVSTF